MPVRPVPAVAPARRHAPTGPAPRPGALRATEDLDLGQLLAAAVAGDDVAFAELTRRCAPAVRGVTRRYRLGAADADDVAQATWLALLEHAYSVREPAALVGWVATTAHRICLRLVQGPVREVLVDELPQAADGKGIHAEVEAAERDAALRTALDGLRPRERKLMDLLLSEPDLPYRDIGARLGMPVGSIGPTRQRCLTRLRDAPELAAYAPTC